MQRKPVRASLTSKEIEEAVKQLIVQGIIVDAGSSWSEETGCSEPLWGFAEHDQPEQWVRLRPSAAAASNADAGSA